jgi:hypothetical protein
VQPCDEDEEKDDKIFSFFQAMEHRWNEIDRGKPKYSGKHLSQCHFLPPQIPHGLAPGSNPGLRGERPATNILSHGADKTSLTPYQRRYVVFFVYFFSDIGCSAVEIVFK